MIVLAHTDLPEFVAPEIKQCGISQIGNDKGTPVISFPTGT